MSDDEERVTMPFKFVTGRSIAKFPFWLTRANFVIQLVCPNTTLITAKPASFIEVLKKDLGTLLMLANLFRI